MKNDEKAGNGEEHKNIIVHIDNKPHSISKNPMSGRELLVLAGVDYQKFDLYLEIRGAGDDKQVGNNESITIEPGMHFTTVPSRINPGK